MLSFCVNRWMHLLAAALVAVWPAAAASACCCAAGQAQDAESGCQRDCCADDAAAGSQASPAAEFCQHCCPSAEERTSCGCGQSCGAIERDLSGTSQPSWRSFGAAPVITWHDLRREFASAPSVAIGATSIPTRSVRVLYCVWRN